MKIRIDTERCMGSGNCSFYAPATFDLGDEGWAIVLDENGDPEEKIMLAVKGCPTQAIFVNEKNGAGD